jgi:hypothetical protein
LTSQMEFVRNLVSQEGANMKTEKQTETIRKIVAQGMAAKIPAHFTAKKITEAMESFSRGEVWVVTIQLAETVIAVGSTEATALHWAGVQAVEFLTLRDCTDDNGDPWQPATVAEWFGYRSTKLDIDGDGDIH